MLYGGVVAPLPSARCISTLSIQRPNLKPTAVEHADHDGSRVLRCSAIEGNCAAVADHRDHLTKAAGLAFADQALSAARGRRPLLHVRRDVDRILDGPSIARPRRDRARNRRSRRPRRRARPPDRDIRPQARRRAGAPSRLRPAARSQRTRCRGARNARRCAVIAAMSRRLGGADGRIGHRPSVPIKNAPAHRRGV